MERYLLVARSITHAQQMMKVLDRAGIRTRVLRASAELTGRGCGYTLEVAERNYAAAIRRLQDAQVERRRRPSAAEALPPSCSVYPRRSRSSLPPTRRTP